MKKTVITLSAMLLLAALLPSCGKLGRTGKPVVFSATAHGEAGTRTQYAGGLSDSDNHEAIYWSSGDQILIQSDDASVASATGGVTSVPYGLTIDSNESLATLNPGSTTLEWQDESGTTTFYGLYPSPADMPSQNGVYSMSIPSEQTVTCTTTGDVTTAAPDMRYAFMVAKNTSAGNSESSVPLEFYPAFTAFEINMKSQTGTVALNSIAIKSSSQDLAGDYVTDATGSSVTYAPATGGATFKSVSAALDGQSISSTTSLNLTLLALPYELTKLYMEVTYTIKDESNNDLTLTKKLFLKDASGYLTFDACKKHRITGLIFNDNSDLRLTVNGVDLPWDRNDDSTSFASNIESGPFIISNATETGNHYYPTGTKDYQVRTLDIANGYSYFDVEFQPAAPLGGYWMLIPESNGGLGTAAFRVVLWDEEDTNLLTDGDLDLKGQIMNQTVHFRVISTVSEADRTQDHAIIIKSYFSTSITFDENSTYSADSEIQDAHKDGSFSYWRFVIPAKNN